MKNRVHNFSAGPATLPLEVLESIKEELINYKDIGSSIIEISHRDKTFVEIAEKTEETLRDLLSICLLYTSPSPRDGLLSRMPSSA